MTKMCKLVSSLLGLVTLVTLAACDSLEPTHSTSPMPTPTPQPTKTAISISTPQSTEVTTLTPTQLPATATPRPTQVPTVSKPTETPYVTRTPIPASRIHGEWRRFTTADGLCTNWPVFIGVWYIGTDTTTVCRSTGLAADEIAWSTRVVPLGTRVTAVGKFPPGGAELYATDAGVCWFYGDEWECQALAEGYPHGNIQRITNIMVEPVLMLVDAVVYREQTYDIAAIVGVEDAYPTSIAVLGQYGSREPEIWVGTNGYGIVVIQPETEKTMRHTEADGLQINEVRAIDVGAGVWVATDTGVMQWDGERWTTYTTADGLPSNNVRGISAGEANTVWIATAGGAAYFDGRLWQAFTHENGLPEGDLNGVRFTVEGIWFSTRGRGLLAFFIQEPPDKIVEGYGDFPRLPVIAPGADSTTLALYLVEGDRATQLVEFEGLRIGNDSVMVWPSPDSRHIAALLLDSWDGASTLEVLDVKEVRRVTLDEGAGDLTSERGAAHEDITWLAWLDDEHILYSKVTAPSTEEVEASRETGTPLPVRGEIWLADLQGETERLLAQAPVQRVLGASPDGKRVYFTCHSQPGREGYRADGFCVLDVDSGTVRMLWPSTDRPLEGSTLSNDTFFGYKLVTMPDGKQRVLFVGTEHHQGPPANPADVWLADPEREEAERIWTADQGGSFPDSWVAYDTPIDFLWSPRSEEKFAYLGDGHAFGGVWWVDTGVRQTGNLMPGGLHLIAWTEEGIVVQSEEALWLLDEAGEVRGEIRFQGEGALGLLQVANEVVNYDVSYVHQWWDTPEWWDSFNPTRWGGVGPAVPAAR